MKSRAVKHYSEYKSIILPGVYFWFKNTETDKMENRVFEDLPESEQDRIMSKVNKDWLKRMVKILSNKLNEIGDAFEIVIE